MSGALLIIPGLVAGGMGTALVLWLLRRRDAGLSQPGADGPPVLEWILRANAARGAWLVGPGSREHATPRGGMPESLNRNIQARLEQQRTGDGQGVERFDDGILVYASLDGRAAGLFLPSECSTGEKATALRDLARFLDYDRWKPVLTDIAREQGTPGESVESVALRLAHQLEKLLGVESCVALARSNGVEIAGVSLRSDRRLMKTLVESGSALELAALGGASAMTGVIAPFGSVISDRRKRKDPSFVWPIPGSAGPLGAVAVWTAEGSEPSGTALSDFRNAVGNAAPRLQGALERTALRDSAIRDPLTGLRNRRGLSEVMTSISDPHGALVYADLDRFKILNDTLGHPAGDAALTHVSRVLMQAVRDQDTVARIGGEEFAIWIPDATLERGRQVAERIRQALAWSDWKWQGERWPLTASFGVAACPESSATREGLAMQADAAL
jgi:diguanylate cyclase (GGDEF)-like protein